MIKEVAMTDIKVNDNFIKTNDEELFTIIGVQEESIDSLDTAPYSYWREVFKVLMKNKVVWICLGILAVVVFFTIFGNFWSYYDPNIPNLNLKYAAPSAEHWFGCNKDGNDLWTLTWSGAKISLLLAIIVSVINAVLGLFIGSIWGFFPKLDPILIEIRNFLTNIPSLLLNMMFMKTFLMSGMDAFWAIVLVMTIFGWLGLASMIRNQIIIIRNRDFNVASRTLGSKPHNMILHNLLPQLISIIVILLANSIPAAIDGEVSLSFFGLSLSSVSRPTLGQVINNGAADPNWTVSPHIVMLPALVTILITVTFYYIGFAMADASDPKSHR